MAIDQAHQILFRNGLIVRGFYPFCQQDVNLYRGVITDFWRLFRVLYICLFQTLKSFIFKKLSAVFVKSLLTFHLLVNVVIDFSSPEVGENVVRIAEC